MSHVYDLGGPVAFVLDSERIIDRNRDITDEIRAFIERRLRHFFGESLSQTQRDTGPELVVRLSTINPLFDARLIAETVPIARRRRGPVRIEGAVPGTAPTLVTGGTDAIPFVFLSDRQHTWNSQLNLFKLKRLKVFLSLCRALPHLHTMEVDEVLEYLSNADGIRLVVSYGEPIELKSFPSCPACGNDFLRPLHCGESQPRIGYLTRRSSCYSFCGSCGLVFLNPAPGEEDLYRYYDWYDKEDVQPTFEFDLSKACYTDHYAYVLSQFQGKIPDRARVIDMGGGSGYFAVHAKLANPSWHVSLVDFECVSAAHLKSRYGIEARSADFIKQDFGEGLYDAVTMFEVLEHLRYERLKDVFRRVHSALVPHGFFAFSTPDFESPLCRVADFWSAFVPQHLTVLSRRVLEPIWEAAGFRLVDFKHRALLIRSDYGEMTYLAANGGSLATRAHGELMAGLLKAGRPGDDIRRNLVEEQNRGVEMIVTLQRNT